MFHKDTSPSYQSSSSFQLSRGIRSELVGSKPQGDAHQRPKEDVSGKVQEKVEPAKADQDGGDVGGDPSLFMLQEDGGSATKGPCGMGRWEG